MNLYVDDFDRISDVKQHPELKEIFKYPHANWICGHRGNLTSSIQRYCKRAADKLPTFVLYNIPNRDLNHHSKGGAQDYDSYLKFVEDFSIGLGDNKAIIIVEPDAIPHACHTRDNLLLAFRLTIIKAALSILSRNVNARIYIDVGHPRWIPFDQIITTLNAINLPYTGFSLNVSNYIPTDECLVYGQLISQMTGKTFVIDTSRNGNKPLSDEWCNPAWATCGTKPTLDTKIRNCDGFLWIKIPGESDGRCNGGPKAGRFSPLHAQYLLSGINS
jgi:endoglucanase